MAIVKGDKMDFVVQKATELGVTRVIPVTTARSVPRGLDASGAVRALGKRARWVKIAREGARQCGRVDVPEVEPVAPLATALKAAHKEAFKLMLWEGAREHTLRQVLPPAKSRSGSSCWSARGRLHRRGGAGGARRRLRGGRAGAAHPAHRDGGGGRC